MDTTELIGPLQAPSVDQLRIVARPVATEGRDFVVVSEWLPIWPFMFLVALAVLAFAPLFAVSALVVLTAAIFAAPFLLIRHLLGRG
jgi:hypothetical protein